MATVSAPLPGSPLLTEGHLSLSRELRRLTRVATVVAVISIPSVFWWLHHHDRWSTGKALFVTLLSILVCRGFLEILIRRLIPWPSLFGTDDARLSEEDAMNRRRAWTWGSVFRWIRRYFVIVTTIWIFLTVIIWVVSLFATAHRRFSFGAVAVALPRGLYDFVRSSQDRALLIELPFLFGANFLIFLGPLLMMGIMQIRGYEPGDAEWGVKLDHVRGQAEAKEEIRRVVTLWQSGEVFEGAGGKRERGLLFLGAPGTGKTMMAKAIATGFNSPFVSIPGSGFAQTFIGLDAIIVRFLAMKAKKLARKWGGQCIVFIDEIDAVGMRRQSLGGGGSSMTPGLTRRCSASNASTSAPSARSTPAVT